MYLYFYCAGTKHHIAKGKEVLEALIQRYCLHELSSMFYNSKLWKRYVVVMWDNQCVYWCFFCNQKTQFHQLGSFKLIKTMLKSLNVCKVNLQCGIVIQRAVTKHGLPSVQLSRMMNMKIKFAKNKCLGTIWSTEMNPIAWTYPTREHNRNAYFLWLYNLTPTWFVTNFL